MAAWLQALLAAACAAHALLRARQTAALRERLRRKEEEAALLSEERRAERTGRTRAERDARELQLRLAAGGGAVPPPGAGAEGAAGAAGVDWLSVAFPLRPIGVLRSAFGRRNGTPRQPGLVPAARAELCLRPDLPPGLLAGLEGFSHCWLLYVFHQNTDLQRLWQGDYRGVRASVRVPRLDGGRRGALATRAPHRPCPIGLSLARVLAVNGGRLVLGGADVLDGTPVLDVKPFTWADAAPGATAPAWVAAEAAAAEPLALGAVRLAPGAEAALHTGWAARGAASLYASFEGLRELVLQALARDVRSVTQRKKVPGREREGRGVPALTAPAAAPPPGTAREGKWHIVLDGLDISYDVDDGGGVEVVGARLAGSTVEGGADPG